jgi:arylsulfatase A-like enzyme
MGYKGHPHLQTPNFDALAREGLRFDRFYATAPVCSPTRGSVLTGRHPNRYGCFQFSHASQSRFAPPPPSRQNLSFLCYLCYLMRNSA